MNGDCHNPNLPCNLYPIITLPNKAIKVPLNHKIILELMQIIANINTKQITYIVTRTLFTPL